MLKGDDVQRRALGGADLELKLRDGWMDRQMGLRRLGWS